MPANPALIEKINTLCGLIDHQHARSKDERTSDRDPHGFAAVQVTQHELAGALDTNPLKRHVGTRVGVRHRYPTREQTRANLVEDPSSNR